MIARDTPALSSKGISKRAKGSPPATCAAMRTDGKPCHCSALPGDPHGMCFWHSPARAGERATAQMRGGHTRQHAVGIRNAPVVHLESMEEVREILADVITKVRRGQLEVKSANSMAYLLMQATKVVQMSDMERRLKALEAGSNGQGKTS